MVLRPEKSEVKGFTLIELLVVIAIIALLMAIILPALNTAKLMAKQVVCSAQMKQWTLATFAYAAENTDAIPPYADTLDQTMSGNALDRDTYYHNRLSPYLTGVSHGKWGMDYGNRRCPMGKTDWGETAVWIGVYYGKHNPDRAPFVFLNSWNGAKLTNMCNPFKTTSVRTPAKYLTMLDVRRDHVFEPITYQWDTDCDLDGMKDSHNNFISSLGPYNFAQPKAHRGGCNVSLFDGHTEWIRYQEFWQLGENGYPAHPYWWNQNKP